MRAHPPPLVGGPDGADFQLMRAAPGWFAKGGAEGLLQAAGPGDRGRPEVRGRLVIVRSTSALAAFGPLGPTLPGLAELPIVNSRGERVGEFAVSRL